MELSTPSQGQLYFRFAIVKVERQRDQREGVLLGQPHQLVNLAPVQEKFPAAVGVVGAEPRSELPWWNVDPKKPHLTVRDPGVGIGKLGFAFPE